jgi:hypothetical protein
MTFMVLPMMKPPMPAPPMMTSSKGWLRTLQVAAHGHEAAEDAAEGNDQDR